MLDMYGIIIFWFLLFFFLLFCFYFLLGNGLSGDYWHGIHHSVSFFYCLITFLSSQQKSADIHPPL